MNIIRVKIRTDIDVTKPVNLKKLSPIDKVKVGFITQWRQTKFYQKWKQREEETKLSEQSAKDNYVKESILSYLYSELVQNRELSKKNQKCKEVVLEIPYEYYENVCRVLKHKDFNSYDISLVEENKDLRRAFSDMPFLIKAKSKLL